MTENQAMCAVCHEFFPADEAEAHLRNAHAAPSGGFMFFYEARPYFTEKPSMQVGELLGIVGGNVTYQFFQDTGPHQPDIPFSHAQAVDLTKEPWFYSVPPATF